MTITINRNVLIFVVALVALAVVGYFVGTSLGGGTGQTTAPAAVTATLPALADPGGVQPELDIPTPMADTAPRIEIDAFKAEFDAQVDMIVVDVRTPDAFAAGHITGSVNIPEAEIVQRQGELPKDKHIVLYCA